MKYFDNLEKDILDYFKILSEEIPSWLEEYIDTNSMERLKYISYDCGNDYLNMFPKHIWYSNLDHSVGVALITYHFTKDKKQTLASLFHDISTPCFRHCIDFMNGDALKQESTEKGTKEIIENDEKIVELLKRDNIDINNVCDYKKYPICDNEIPKLSSDRLEYNLSCGYFFYKSWDMDSLKRVYNDIYPAYDEEGNVELSFHHIMGAQEFVRRSVNSWSTWISPKIRIANQFYADICALMNEFGYLTIKDLYTLKDSEIINKIENCENDYIRESFKKFKTLTEVHDKRIHPNDYLIDVETKRRYINPLVNNEVMYGRATNLSDDSLLRIERYNLLPNKGDVSVELEFSKELIRKKTKK